MLCLLTLLVSHMPLSSLQSLFNENTQKLCKISELIWFFLVIQLNHASASLFIHPSMSTTMLTDASDENPSIEGPSSPLSTSSTGARAADLACLRATPLEELVLDLLMTLEDMNMGSRNDMDFIAVLCNRCCFRWRASDIAMPTPTPSYMPASFSWHSASSLTAIAYHPGH